MFALFDTLRLLPLGSTAKLEAAAAEYEEKNPSFFTPRPDEDEFDSG